MRAESDEGSRRIGEYEGSADGAGKGDAMSGGPGPARRRAGVFGMDVDRNGALLMGMDEEGRYLDMLRGMGCDVMREWLSVMSRDGAL